MKFARIAIGTQTLLAQLEGEGATPLLVDNGEAWADPLRVWLENDRPDPIGDVISTSSAEMLAPVRAPQKVLCVGLNYRDHAAETGLDLPTAPLLFTKSPGAIIGPKDAISWSKAETEQVDFEAELAVVIGRRARNVSEADALSYVLGYTVCNDVSARDVQKADGQFFRAKSFDTFCPLGPWIVSADEVPDPQKLSIQTHINGELFQDGTTADMIYSVAEVISYASRFMTLEPGDVITTGTPPGSGVGRTPPVFLKDGDAVEVTIEGVGTLTNPVVVTE